MSSVWGDRIKLSIFGGSHTAAIGVNIDGLPPGEQIDMNQVRTQLGRRAPGRDSATTSRAEKDEPIVICGMTQEGVLTGDPLCAIIENKNQRSGDYRAVLDTPRPGHADYTANVKYKGNADLRGGGHFSGRLTAPLVFAGAVCRQILKRRGIAIGAHAASVADVFDKPFDMVDPGELALLEGQYFPVRSEEVKERMYEKIAQARGEGDSLGGTAECAVTGLPAGLGSPMFMGVENKISSIVFGIPAVKGIEFGAGFSAALKMGSENNDMFYYDDQGAVRTRTNNAGGILGGITTGMPVIFRVAVKPTPSISRTQQTLNLKSKMVQDFSIEGRHDPCILPRIVPVIEAAVAIAVMDMWICERGYTNA